MELTELESVEKTRDMWECIRDNSEMSKEDYLRMKGIPREEWPGNECYLCEYSELDCEICPLIDMWSEKLVSDSECCNPDSPFQLWADAYQFGDYEECAIQANKIVELCNKKIAMLKNTEKL